MKSFVIIFLLCLIPALAMAQKEPTWGYVTAQQADSLRRSVQTEKNDTLKMAAFRSLGFYYQDFITDSGLYFHEQQLVLAKKLNKKLWQADAYSQAGFCLGLLGNTMKAYEYHSEAMKLAGDEKNESDKWRPWTFSNSENGHDARIAIMGMNYMMMGNLWGALGEREKQRSDYEEAVKLGTSINNGKVQNPLNFVNNFSEVSKELLDEMKTALENGDAVDAKQIAEDVIQNLEKINHHGKRADAIVKGMLQHSRSSSAIKEPTDINALADEYLRLSYHGLRAKDKSFNATFKTDFDLSLEKINIIPQDIGRVILNLLTNAFYVVNEKKKQQSNDYEPTVLVQTIKINDRIEIKVADNGNGIPQKILDKIFQPFFTTKPTGQGTGLGLSLSYDIIKAHGGELKVETKENEGSTFIIQIPSI